MKTNADLTKAANEPDQNEKVALCASSFGGTGVAAAEMMLKEFGETGNWHKNQMKVKAFLIHPYFSIKPGDNIDEHWDESEAENRHAEVRRHYRLRRNEDVQFIGSAYPERWMRGRYKPDKQENLPDLTEWTAAIELAAWLQEEDGHNTWSLRADMQQARERFYELAVIWIKRFHPALPPSPEQMKRFPAFSPMFYGDIHCSMGLYRYARHADTAPVTPGAPAAPTATGTPATSGTTVPLRLILLFQNTATASDFPLNTKDHPHIWQRVTSPGDHLQEFAIATWVKCQCSSASSFSSDLCTECSNVACHYSADYQPSLPQSTTHALGFAYRPYLAIPSIDAPDFFGENGEYCIPQELTARQRLHKLLELYHTITQAEFSASNLLFALQSVIDDHLKGNTSTTLVHNKTTFVQRLSGLSTTIYPKASLPQSGLAYIDPYEIWQLN